MQILLLPGQFIWFFVLVWLKLVFPIECFRAKLMSMCWRRHSDERPTFDDIIEYLLPDLGSKFYQVSHYFTRTKDSRLQQNSDLEKVEQESKEEELEDHSTTPLNHSFALKSPTMMKPELAFDYFCFDAHHITSGEPNVLQAECNELSAVSLSQMQKNIRCIDQLGVGKWRWFTAVNLLTLPTLASSNFHSSTYWLTRNSKQPWTELTPTITHKRCQWCSSTIAVLMLPNFTVLRFLIIRDATLIVLYKFMR